MFGFKKQLFPSREWVEKNIPHPHEESYTPDKLWLEKHEWCLVFFYDDGSRKSLLGEDAMFKGGAFTKDHNFVMWKKRLGTESFPIPLDGADRVYDGPGITSRPMWKMGGNEVRPGIRGRIKGSLYAVRPKQFWNGLDKHYFNGLEFTRQRVRVLIPYRVQQGHMGVDHNEFVQEVRAWMYVGVKDYWHKQLDGGLMFTPVGAFAPKNQYSDGRRIGIYYCYTRLEDETNY